MPRSSVLAGRSGIPMQFSRATEYALLGLAHLAREPNNSASVSKIAQREKLSIYFLRNVFQKLKIAKLVQPHRGSGYTLVKKPKQISLKNVLEAVEGPIAIHACLKQRNTKCMHSKSCRIIKTWGRIQKNFINDLQTATLAELI